MFCEGAVTKFRNWSILDCFSDSNRQNCRALFSIMISDIMINPSAGDHNIKINHNELNL